jgi:hypothetical protein
MTRRELDELLRESLARHTDVLRQVRLCLGGSELGDLVAGWVESSFEAGRLHGAVLSDLLEGRVDEG